MENKQINKYLITLVIPYEGKSTWTVFAHSAEQAKDLVKTGYCGYCCSGLSSEVLKSNIKGTNQCFVHKSNLY